MEEKILLSDEELEKVTGGLNNIDTNYYPSKKENKQIEIIANNSNNINNNNNNSGVSSIGAGEGGNVTKLNLDSWDENLSIGK